MKIIINKDTGIPMFPQDQMMLVPALKDCYRHFGLHGLHYAVLWGWEGSPYKTLVDEIERDVVCYDALRVVDLYDVVKGKLAKPDKVTQNMYENVFIKKAVEAINNIAPVPQLQLRNYYLTQIAKYRKNADDIIFKPSDAKAFKDQTSTHASIMTSIRTMTKTVAEIDKEMEEAFKLEKVMTLDMLISNT